MAGLRGLIIPEGSPYRFNLPAEWGLWMLKGWDWEISGESGGGFRRGPFGHGKGSGEVTAAMGHTAPLLTLCLGYHGCWDRLGGYHDGLFTILRQVFAEAALGAGDVRSILVIVGIQVSRAAGAQLKPKHINSLNQAGWGPQDGVRKIGSNN